MGQSWTEWIQLFPWADIGWALGALTLIALMVYLLRPGGSADFTITVDGEAILFSGRIQNAARASIEEFLLNDIALLDAYTIRGKWDGRVLVVSVTAAGKPQEQRIRNFLKLHLKPPLASDND